MSKKSVLGIGVLIVVVIAIGIYFNKEMLPDWVVLPSEYQDTYKCAENGNPICQRQIAEIFEGNDYRSGMPEAGTILLPFRAPKWYLKAALQGDKRSMGSYGWFLCANLWRNPDAIINLTDGLAWIMLEESFQLDLFKMDDKTRYNISISDCHKQHSIMHPNESWEDALIKAEKRARELAEKIREPDNFIWDDVR